MSRILLFVKNENHFRIKVISEDVQEPSTKIDMTLDEAIKYNEFLFNQIKNKDLQRISLNSSIDICRKSAIGLYEHLSKYIDFILTDWIGENPFNNKPNTKSN